MQQIPAGRPWLITITTDHGAPLLTASRQERQPGDLSSGRLAYGLTADAPQIVTRDDSWVDAKTGETAMSDAIARRTLLNGLLATLAATTTDASLAHSARISFAQWVESFRARARARGVAEATYQRVMGAIKPDTEVLDLERSQPEFREPMWQYINRRVSDWRIITGKARAVEHAALIERIENQYGVDRYLMLGLWGMESAFGEVVTSRKHMRPVIPALAALAWGEPRRRSYWEGELLNALLIIERGWADEKDMIGSWAGAMGHTQWMPQVWLSMGVDGNGDGRISPFGPPDDAFAGTAHYLVKRGRYRRGEGWGYEVRLPAKARSGARERSRFGRSLGARARTANLSPDPASRRAFGSPSPVVRCS